MYGKFQFWKNEEGCYSLCKPEDKHAYGILIWEYTGFWEDAVKKKDEWFDGPDKF